MKDLRKFIKTTIREYLNENSIQKYYGYKVGKFCHLVQNLHIYDRHFDGVDELLNKETLDIQPKLILKENKNFYEYTVDDFEITGIDGITKINSKLEMAI